MVDERNGVAGLHFGALAPSLEEQLQEQDLGVKDCRLYQLSADAATRLHLAGLLTDAETTRVLRRLTRMVEKAAKPLNGVRPWANHG